VIAKGGAGFVASVS